MRLAVPDLISNSYFPAISAVELGDFAEQGLDVRHELIFPVDKSYQALRDGEVDFIGGSAHAVLSAFPAQCGDRPDEIAVTARARPPGIPGHRGGRAGVGGPIVPTGAAPSLR